MRGPRGILIPLTNNQHFSVLLACQIEDASLDASLPGCIVTRGAPKVIDLEKMESRIATFARTECASEKLASFRRGSDETPDDSPFTRALSLDRVPLWTLRARMRAHRAIPREQADRWRSRWRIRSGDDLC